MSLEDKNEKTGVLIGSFKKDKITNELYVSGMPFVSYELTSSPENWNKILNYLKNNNERISFVIMSLSESVLLIAQCKKYSELFNVLIERIKQFPHLFFLYEDNRFSKFNIFNQHYYHKYMYYNLYWDDPKEFYHIVNSSVEESDVKDQEIRIRYFINIFKTFYAFNIIFSILCTFSDIYSFRAST